TNTATLPLTNVRAKLVAPASFKAKKSEPAAKQNNDTWEYEEFASNATEEVVVTGVLSADGGTEQEFILQVGIVEPNGLFNVQAELPVTIKIINPELETNL